MTWISLICLLALSSSVFARPGYGGYGSASLQQMPLVRNILRDQQIQRPVLSQGYGKPEITESFSTVFQQQDLPKIQTGYGSSMLSSLPKTFSSSGYGAMPRTLIFDQTPAPVEQPILTQADILCRGQVAETVIPLENGRKFVVCLDESKGVEQYCPKGLFYHPTSRRCERKLGPLENLCSSQPCLNGGQCVPTESHYQCQCAPGFDGVHCELDARVCQQQQPCGGEARCQSFRFGAALDHVCIFQDGVAYGLTVGQTVANPCSGVDGPFALSVSNKGFIMCDGERMFVESCPGGTIWDDLNKACVWPDMEAAVPQFEQEKSYGSYGESRPIIKSSYAGRVLPQQFEQHRLVHSHGLPINKPRFFKAPVTDYQTENFESKTLQQPILSQSWGSQMSVQQPVLEQPKLISTPSVEYGQQMTIQPSLEQPRVHSYGSQITRPVFEQPKIISTPSAEYGQQMTIQPSLDQSRLQSYGSQITRPVLEQPKLISTPSAEYGQQITIQPSLEQPRVQSYGSQITRPVFEQPKLVQSSSSY